MGWHLALLVGTAVAATDPAVVFSVFGRREIAGRTGVLLEGESGANDPVGIALLSALLAAHGSAGAIIGHVVAEFALQMTVGVAVGVAGGLALLAFMRRVPLPSEGLYSPRVLAGVLVIFGVATVAQGSGFLAVLVAGIILGDEPAPYKREITAVPLLARQPGRDRRVHDARAHHAAVRAREQVRLGGRPRPGGAADVRHPPGPRRPGPAAGPADGARAHLLPLDRAQGRGADPARAGHPRLRHRPAPPRPIR